MRPKLQLHITISSLLMLLFFLINQTKAAQPNNINYQVDYQNVFSSGVHAPFWIQSKRHGKISPHPLSTNIGFSIYKEFATKDKLIDYEFNVDGFLRTSNISAPELILQQFYLQSKFWIFDLTIGIKELFYGCHNPQLSTGGYLFAENAPPMPRITAGIEKFTSIPLTWDMVQIKGALSHGWFNDNVYVPGILLHHKYLHFKLGNHLPVSLQAGLDHVAQWSGELPGGVNQTFNLKNYSAIFFGNSGGDDALLSEQINALGNHIISEHINIDVDIKNFNINIYWQNVMEDGPIRLLPWLAMNWRDGLWGIHIQNEQFPFIQGLVYEFFNTLDQSGPWHDKDGIVYGGRDSYFTNGIYKNGWTYKGRTIGIPLILSPVFNKDGSFQIFYNDVQAHHIGIKGNKKDFTYRFLGTYSQYYPDNNLPAYSNFSGLFEIKKLIKEMDNTTIGVSLGIDTGKIPGKSVGMMITIRKSGILFQR